MKREYVSVQTNLINRFLVAIKWLIRLQFRQIIYSWRTESNCKVANNVYSCAQRLETDREMSGWRHSLDDGIIYLGKCMMMMIGRAGVIVIFRGKRHLALMLTLFGSNTIGFAHLPFGGALSNWEQSTETGRAHAANRICILAPATKFYFISFPSIIGDDGDSDATWALLTRSFPFKFIAVHFKEGLMKSFAVINCQ